MVTLFIDVDGVMYPLRSALVEIDDARVRAASMGLVSKGVAAGVVALGVQMVWLTTWQHQANTVIAPLLGWTQLPVVERSGYSEQPWWKLNAILNHISLGGGPFVWVDDHIPMMSEEVGAALAECPVPYLLVSPEPEVGLGQQELRSMRRFVFEAASWRPQRKVVIWEEGNGPYMTKSGRLLTDEDIAGFAEEAERGYDIEP